MARCFARFLALPWHDVLDESDVVLDVRRQLVYAVGLPAPLPSLAERCLVLRAVLEAMHASRCVRALLRRLARTGEAVVLRPPSSPGAFYDELRVVPGAPQWDAARAELNLALARYLIRGDGEGDGEGDGNDGDSGGKDVGGGGSDNSSAGNRHRRPQRKQLQQQPPKLRFLGNLAQWCGEATVVRYITNHAVPADAVISPGTIAAGGGAGNGVSNSGASSSGHNVRRERLLVLRGLLACDVLWHCLSLRHRVDYGVPRGVRPRRTAVPFRAADVPSPRAEFAQPDKTLVLTTLSHACVFASLGVGGAAYA